MRGVDWKEMVQEEKERLHSSIELIFICNNNCLNKAGWCIREMHKLVVSKGKRRNVFTTKKMEAKSM